jgi:hypothetical protein
VDTRVKPGDADAVRGLLLALGGTLLLPIVIAAVAVSPQGARAWVFELGCIGAAAVALWGGVYARRALTVGTDRTAIAMIASVIGFVVGVTTALMAFWALIGLAL